MKRIILAGALCLVAGACPALAGDAFRRLEGQWQGKGTIEFSNKSKETLRCRASYDVLQSGANVQLAIRCASDSYRIELMGNANEAGGASGAAISPSSTRKPRSLTCKSARPRYSIDPSGS